MKGYYFLVNTNCHSLFWTRFPKFIFRPLSQPRSFCFVRMRKNLFTFIYYGISLILSVLFRMRYYFFNWYQQWILWRNLAQYQIGFIFFFKPFTTGVFFLRYRKSLMHCTSITNPVFFLHSRNPSGINQKSQ